MDNMIVIIASFILGISNALDSNVCKSSFLTTGKLNVSTINTSNDRDFTNGEWCGTNTSLSNWIEFNFKSPVGIRQIEIGKPPHGAGYVTKFSIQYVGIQGNVLQNYGNDPNHAAVIKALDSRNDRSIIEMTGIAVTAFRINIIDYSQQPCLKLDLFGCTDPNELCTSLCQNEGQCVYEETCACIAGYEGNQCEKPVSHTGECLSRLGMMDKRIPDSSLVVSSSRIGHGKEHARYGCCTSQVDGAWCPADSDKSPWYEVKFDKPQSIGGFDFLPPNQLPGVIPTEYMKTFILEYLSAFDSDNVRRVYAKGIPAIYNDTTYYTIQLQPPITATGIRIIPQTYKKYPCFRFDILGCDPKVLCPADFCKHGGSCMGENVCLCKTGYIGSRCEHTASQVKEVNAGFQTIIHNILQTTNVSNVTFEIHGNPELVTGETGKALHITSSNQYVIVDSNSFNSCLTDIDNCNDGFTIKTNVNFAKLTDDTYIISSGGDLPNHKGISLYYKNNLIHFVVSTSTKTWHLTSPYNVTLNAWHHLELSWHKSLGIELLDNGNVVGTSTMPIPSQATIVKPIAIGYGYTQSATDIIDMKVEGLNIFDANRASPVIAGILSKSNRRKIIELRPRFHIEDNQGIDSDKRITYTPLDLSLKKRKREDDEDKEFVQEYRNTKLPVLPSVAVGEISVKLECYELWQSFSENLMEMIITRKGRRMFPAVAISVQGMNPSASYRIMLQILPSDPFLYKFINQTWTRGRYNGFETTNSPYEHELSPKSGRVWMDNTIHFHSVKLTNCRFSSDAHFLLKAMQKYNACITIIEYLGDTPYKVYNHPFPETTFIAVTAYHSRMIVDKKIDCNPFAKAFKRKGKDDQNDKDSELTSEYNLG